MKMDNTPLRNLEGKNTVEDKHPGEKPFHLHSNRNNVHQQIWRATKTDQKHDRNQQNKRERPKFKPKEKIRPW